MSWVINVIENNVMVDDKAQMALSGYDDSIFEEGGTRGAIGGHLVFDSDDMEWIDYLSDEVIEILISYGAHGTVTFGDLDGDNFGSFWGYEFIPNKCVKLTGTLVWATTT